MPIHDWTRVNPGIFHAFHHSWIEEISRVLNRGLLPTDYYALLTRIAGELGSVRFNAKPEVEQYADKANAISIRHSSNHQVVAMIEIVSPGNKSNRHGLNELVSKALEFLRAGIHLLIVDLFPPDPRDPEGIHQAIWREVTEGNLDQFPNQQSGVAAYVGWPTTERYFEPTAVGESLVDMPLFLTPDHYVAVPMDSTYQSAWQSVPAIWQRRMQESP